MNNLLTENEQFAVIDLGSTSFHLVIARKVQNTLQIISKLKYHVHLAAGLDEHNYLTDESITRGMACLTLFAERLQDFNARNVRIVATHTLRIAKNNYRFIELAKNILPFPIEIISGQEEARLIYFAMYTTQPEKNNKLVIDIGGGSTELALGCGMYPDLTESREIGCLTITRHFFAHEQPNIAQFKLAQLIAEQELETIGWEFRQRGWQKAFGTSGTIKAVYHILQTMGYSDGIITAARLEQLIQHVHKIKIANHHYFSSLSKERKQILIGGLAILAALFTSLEIKELHFTPNSLRNGVLYQLTDRQYHNENITTRNIRNFANQYNIDILHAEQVWQTALFMFRQKFADIEKQRYDELSIILYYASYLHEIGLIINHHALHKHSAYIVKNSQISGLNQEQQSFLANVIRYHRKNIKIEDLPQFSLFKQEELLSLIQIFRLSVILNNQRQNHHIYQQIQISFIKFNITLSIPATCLHKNALLQLELEKEANYWRTINNWRLDINPTNLL